MYQDITRPICVHYLYVFIYFISVIKISGIETILFQFFQAIVYNRTRAGKVNLASCISHPVFKQLNSDVATVVYKSCCMLLSCAAKLNALVTELDEMLHA